MRQAKSHRTHLENMYISFASKACFHTAEILLNEM